MTENIIEDVVWKLEFEVLLDESFDVLCKDKSITPTNNKKVLSLINDFEDGDWRYQKFENFLWNNIAETALSHKERASLVNKGHTQLIQSAKKLRLSDKESEDIGKGSEIAEILLYGIMKHHYGALPVVPKIFYKQNANDQAKGADSVHVVISGDDFSLWLGESKFYNSIEDVRLDAIVKSVDDMLETAKLKKENSIITSVSDLATLIDNPALKNRICAALKHEESIDSLKSKLHIPILLLHQCELTKSQSTLTDKYKESIKQYHTQRAESYFKKQIKKCGTLHKYAEIHFHIILFPVPLKATIVDKFVANAAHYQGQ